MNIAVSSRALGRHDRSLTRVGKRVTQEEVAEAIGVSRVWYAMLESGSALRPSIKLVARLCAALMLDSKERNTLFALSAPELHTSTMSSISADSLENGFVVFHLAIKRLLSTSSKAEALAVAGEELAAWFDDTSRIVAWLRYDSQAIEQQAVVETRVAMRTQFWPPGSLARTSALSHERRGVPGQLPENGTRDSSRENCFVHIARSGLGMHRDLERADFIRGKVQTVDGLVIGIHAQNATGRVYSIEDRVFVACLTDFLGFMIGNFKGPSRARNL